MQFEEFGLIEPLLRALRFEGYPHPTPIQEQAIPHVLQGKDMLGCAQTGTGKTAAFALPILQNLANQPRNHKKHPHIRVLVLSPTRELAAQIGESFCAYGRHLDIRSTVVYGGVKQSAQVKALRQGVDVLVATPGRLLDLMGQGLIKLNELEVFVLDEADRMLDMGFIADIRRLIAHIPQQRQTLMFSATMPVAIRSLASNILMDPVEVTVTPNAPAAQTVSHSVYFVEKTLKQSLLQHLMADPTITRALVFTRTKRGADRVSRHLKDAGVQADAIHSDRSQQARLKALAQFKAGRMRVLVASDIVARGLDVDEISHVINFDMPNEPETYIHRIGRTGRAGASGLAISFCSFEERSNLDDIEKLIRQPIIEVAGHPYVSTVPRIKKAAPAAKLSGNRRPLRRNLMGRGYRAR